MPLKTQAELLGLSRSSLYYVPVGSSARELAKEMQELLERFTPDPKYQRPQTAIKNKLERTWNLYGPDLLHTYDIPGLPPDNLQIEGPFR
jgi:hypothetical protein